MTIQERARRVMDDILEWQSSIRGGYGVRTKTATEIIERALEEVVADESERYVPGLFGCRKCDFVLVSQTLFMKSGTVGANNKPQECSNGCGPMWRISWRQHAEEIGKRLEKIVNAAKTSL